MAIKKTDYQEERILEMIFLDVGQGDGCILTIPQAGAKEMDQAKKKSLQQERTEILDELFKRNVGVYGAINLRTDGRRAVVAFRREQLKGVKRWFSYELEKDSQGIFQFQNVGGD